MSEDQTLFRARLTGTIIEDPSDTAPVGERGALVEYARSDTWPGIGPGVELGMARVMLPNAVPCPWYAAALHFWSIATITPPVLTPDLQPRVIVRRDLMSVGPASVCQSIVITLPIIAAVITKWADPSKTVLQGEYIGLGFSDPAGNVDGPRLGYLPVTLGTPPQVSAETLVACFMRVPVSVVPSPPATFTHVWVCQGVGLEDHSHLRSGPGRFGGGVAFAAFSPFTTAEAISLGYTL